MRRFTTVAVDIDCSSCIKVNICSVSSTTSGEVVVDPSIQLYHWQSLGAGANPSWCWQLSPVRAGTQKQTTMRAHINTYGKLVLPFNLRGMSWTVKGIRSNRKPMQTFYLPWYLFGRNSVVEAERWNVLKSWMSCAEDVDCARPWRTEELWIQVCMMPPQSTPTPTVYEAKLKESV